MRGNGCFPITLKSSILGSASIISKSTGRVSANFIEMRDQQATGGALFYAGKYSSNVSNNSGWIFSDAPNDSFGLGLDRSYCSASSVLLKTDNFNGGVSWLWQDGSTNPTFLVTHSGTYSVKVTYANNCFFRDTVNISLTPAAAASNNSPVCSGDTIKLMAGGGTTYHWTGPNGFTSDLQNPIIINSTAALSGVYSVVTTTGTCISPPATTTVTVNPATLAGLSIAASANNICSGTPVTFTATPVNGGTSPSYQWQINGATAGTNSTTFTTNTLANGDLVTCVLTSNATCAAPATSSSIAMVVYTAPVVNAGGYKTIHLGGNTLLNATATGDIADITWSPALGLSDNKILQPIASPAITTLYTITVQTTKGCSSTDTLTVAVGPPVGIDIPVTTVFYTKWRRHK